MLNPRKMRNKTVLCSFPHLNTGWVNGMTGTQAPNLSLIQKALTGIWRGGDEIRNHSHVGF